MSRVDRYGLCDICQAPIQIPGLEAYLCSSGICGEDILIRDKKNKSKIISRHPSKGWVRRSDISKIKEKMEKLEKRKRTRQT